MLVSPRLDDQSFDEIIAEAEGRLPWLCPAWTDHNAHDPGITILELMAWYKEMLQYQMDQLTPALQRGLLRLAGVEPLRASAARCRIELRGCPGPRRELERLTTPQGVTFELSEAVEDVLPSLESVVIRQGEKQLDITANVREGISFQPFRFGGKESVLCLGVNCGDTDKLRLWFQVEPPEGVLRNPADGETPPPRDLVWELEGAGTVEPLLDETWSLSWSGCVVLPVPEGWHTGGDGLRRISIRSARAGCEEQPRLSAVSSSLCDAVQQESRVRRYLFHIGASAEQEVLLTSFQAQNAQLAVFVREESGWRQSADHRWERTAKGRRLIVDGAGACLDGEDNLLVICVDPRVSGQMLFDTRGRSGEELYLNVGDQTVLPGRLELMCMTLCPDGAVRPALWRWVKDLSVCAPRDRVFTYDPVRGTIQFGDGLHGAIPAAGRGSVLVTELVVSWCGRGNVPSDAELAFEDGVRVQNLAAGGGRDAETLSQARARLLNMLSGTDKCLSAGDYARCAKRTPGLRVAGARALPGYDVRNPSLPRPATVTVAVFPAGEERWPEADGRFLELVERWLDRCRTVCVRTHAVPVRYVRFSLSAGVRLMPGTDPQQVRDALDKWFRPREERIGETVRLNELNALIQKLPGVLRVEELELRGMDPNCYRNAAGDLEIPPDALPRPDHFDIRATS